MATVVDSPLTLASTKLASEVVPVKIDETLASLQVLAQLIEGRFVLFTEQGAVVELPEVVLASMRNAVLTLIAGPADEMVSTQDAAKMLGVSRPTLVRLLDSESITYQVTDGGHRRVSRRALAEYRQRDLARRRQALDELAASAEEFGFFS